MIFKIKSSKKVLGILFYLSLFFFITVRFLVAGWLFLAYWYWFVFLLLLRLVNYKLSQKVILRQEMPLFLLVSHVAFILFSIFQSDIGDGAYSVVFIEIVSFFNKEIAQRLANIDFYYWEKKQFFLGISSFVIEIVVFTKLHNLMKSKD